MEKLRLKIKLKKEEIQHYQQEYENAAEGTLRGFIKNKNIVDSRKKKLQKAKEELAKLEMQEEKAQNLTNSKSKSPPAAAKTITPTRGTARNSPANYATSLRKMLARKKLKSDTIVSYYTQKMALLKECSLTASRAASCLIDGLTDGNLKKHLQVQNIRTPEDFLECYSDAIKDNVSKDDSQDSKPTNSSDNAGVPKIIFNSEQHFLYQR